PFFLKRRQEGELPITHPDMTRFNISLEEGVDFVRMALFEMLGGELFVPKIPSYRILDVAEAVAPSVKTTITGIRPGEKLHEEMITASDSYRASEFEKHFVVFPSTDLFDIQAYTHDRGGKACTPGFSYESGTNHDWLSVAMLRQLIRQHVDPGFQPL
ncbi:MAG: polysaccharide biosynthesis protein, partial [Polyangiaceae bacterium]|nr:polysaccharide biosynthesis protein [Polyangiaceae bacterium]